VQLWSTVWRVPTAGGDLWFKASSAIHRFETRLAERLAAVMPDRVVELVALGVPDHRLRRLPELLDEVLGDEQVLLLGRDGGVTADELARLRAVRPDLRAMCAALQDLGLGETIQHDDLHDGQVYLRDGRYRVLDWGDSCVSHPFHTLVVTLRVFAWKHGLVPGSPEMLRLRDAYLEPFGPGFEEAVDVAYRTGTLARAFAWQRYLASEPRHEDPDAVAYGLKLFLANGPIGSWKP